MLSGIPVDRIAALLAVREGTNEINPAPEGVVRLWLQFEAATVTAFPRWRDAYFVRAKGEAERVELDPSLFSEYPVTGVTRRGAICVDPPTGRSWNRSRPKYR